MDYKILYVLTVRCTDQRCEEDLECHQVIDTDDDNIYIKGKRIPRDSLMNIKVINGWNGEQIVQISFFIKEAAIIWIRECFIYILRKGTADMKSAVRREWTNLLDPTFDCMWMPGGKKAEQWLEEMKKIAREIK